MEKQINFIQNLSLEEMCLRRVAVGVWTAKDILVLIQNARDIGYSCCTFESITKYWKENIETQVKHKVSEMVIPDSLKKILMCLVRPVGSEILKWKMFHEFFIYKSSGFFHVNIFEQLRWTSTGAIDYQKTAEELIRLEEFSLYKRYSLACLYCLEDSIRLLWEQFPEERSWLVHGRMNPNEIAERHLEYYWPYVLKGEESQLTCLDPSFNRNAFLATARLGNKVLTEYFFHKLTNEERESSLLLALHNFMRKKRNVMDWPYTFDQVRDADVVCYFLSQMSPEEQAQIVKNYPCDILSCFLDWPWHGVFLDIAAMIWTFLHWSDYEDLLGVVLNLGFYFPGLFQKFFMGSPKRFRSYFVFYESLYFHFFPEFFRDEDKETIKVIFDSINGEDRVTLLSSDKFCKHLDGLILADKWNLIEMCFRQAAVSEREKRLLKQEYTKFLKALATNEMARLYPVKNREPKWRRFFEFLDKFDASAPSKRGLEDEAVIQDKRLCIEEKKNALPSNKEDNCEDDLLH